MNFTAWHLRPSKCFPACFTTFHSTSMHLPWCFNVSMSKQHSQPCSSCWVFRLIPAPWHVAWRLWITTADTTHALPEALLLGGQEVFVLHSESCVQESLFLQWWTFLAAGFMKTEIIEPLVTVTYCSWHLNNTVRERLRYLSLKHTLKIESPMMSDPQGV